jgi:glycosyltransferase involved in cell wall biosynthesis
LGTRPKKEVTGGQKYMNEVIDYLGEYLDLIIWDPFDSKTLENRVSTLNFKSIQSQFRSNLWGIGKLRKAKKGDIIIMNSYFRHRFFFFALWAKYLKKCQLCIFVNAIYHYSRGSRFLNSLDKMITRILLRSATLIIANSKSTKEEIVDIGARDDRIEVIYPRLDMPPKVNFPEIEKEKNVFDIIFIGYCEPFKELHVLIKAIGRLKDLPFCLHIIGDNDSEHEYMNMIKGLIADLGIDKKVVFHGNLERNEISVWFNNADLFVTPSRGEGYGRALAEAMYFRLPVIGADKGASKELIDNGVNGFLFKSGDEQSLSSFILKLYEDEGLRNQLGEKGKELIDKKANYDVNIGYQFLSLLKKYMPNYH